MSKENGHQVFDTGLGGGCLFEFAYETDPLGAIRPPMRYQRVEILVGERIVGGLIVDAVEAKIDGEPVENTWILRIASDRDGAREVAAAALRRDIAVRLIG